MNIVKASDFDITKFSILNQKNGHYAQNQVYPQYVLYPKYEYQFSGSSDCLILSDPVTITKGGIIQKNPFNPTDKDCMRLNINADCPGMQELVSKVFEPIDNLMKAETQKPNKFQFMVNTALNKQTQLKDLQYTPILRDVPNKDDDDIYQEPTKKKVKIKINNKVSHLNGHDNLPQIGILTRVFVPENKFAPIQDRAFKNTPEVINNLDTLRELVPWMSTVRLLLKVQKFWVQKTLGNNLGTTKKTRICGIMLTCEQIYVLDNPIWKQQLKFNPDKAITGLGLNIAAPVAKMYGDYDEDEKKIFVIEDEESDMELELSEMLEPPKYTNKKHD